MHRIHSRWELRCFQVIATTLMNNEKRQLPKDVRKRKRQQATLNQVPPRFLRSSTSTYPFPIHYRRRNGNGTGGLRAKETNNWLCVESNSSTSTIPLCRKGHICP